MVNGTHYLLQDLDQVPDRLDPDELRSRNYTASPYFDSLCVIREALKREVPGFPNYRCAEAGKVVSQVLGWDVLGGIYMPAFKATRRLKEATHIWNPSPDGYLVDLTVDQEDPTIPAVLIVQDDSRIVRAWRILTEAIREATLRDLSKKLFKETGKKVDLEAIANDLRAKLKM
ncbi:MAG: hypothetical protein AABX70_08725 [Nanoarchaeota archaeon]